MARRGGYSRDEAGVEWVKTSQIVYGDAIGSAQQMKQDLYTWMNDAILHHVYRCEMILAQERYQEDEQEARANLQGTPDPNDRRYQVTRPKPTITRPKTGTGSPGRGPRPRP